MNDVFNPEDTGNFEPVSTENFLEEIIVIRKLVMNYAQQFEVRGYVQIADINEKAGVDIAQPVQSAEQGTRVGKWICVLLDSLPDSEIAQWGPYWRMRDITCYMSDISETEIFS